MFDWLLAYLSADDPVERAILEARIAIFIAVCILVIFASALADILGLFWEVATPSALLLIVAAQYGFFVGLLAGGLLFVFLFYWGGRGVRVKTAET